MSEIVKINPKVWGRHWCEFKHLAVAREVSIERLAFIVREVVGADPEMQKVLIRSAYDVGETIREIEETFMLLTEYTTLEAGATVDITKDEYTHLFQQLGHMVCAEEHVSDHLKTAVAELRKEKDDAKKREIAGKVNSLIEVLDKMRLNRQNCVNRFLSWSKVEEVKE